jgi:autotransporter-associated beta strand protein
MTPQTSYSSHQTATGRAAPRRARLRAVLLATSALAALPASVAHAADATWIAPAGNTDFNTGANWSGSARPDGNATFDGVASTQKDVTFSDNATLGGIAVTSGAGDYTFDTNGNAVVFNGAGLSVGSGATLKFTNSGGATDFFRNSTAGQSQIFITSGEVNFFDKSSADHAQIAVSTGATLQFFDTSSAANAKITTSGDVFFRTTSPTAGNAAIEIDAGGTVFFTAQSSGGNASVTLLSNGALDIAAHDTGISLGSLASSGPGSGGDVYLGSKTLTVGTNGQSTTFSGAIHDGTSPEGIALGFPDGGGQGSLTKVGSGTLTLTGFNNDYTGATTVNGGALIVDGDISSSSGVTVNAGGTLGGAGSVSSTTIHDGGTLAPGSSASNVLSVIGDLTFASRATYLIQISPVGTNFTDVQGLATLGGATVAANFAPGMTVTRQQYNILTSNGALTDTFNSQVKTNLSPIFKTSLSYETNDVLLNVDIASPSDLAGLNKNQRNVGTALINAFHVAGDSLSGTFATLSETGMAQVSGETAVGTQQATFDAMNQFMGVLLDPTAGALSGGRARDANASMARKAPMAEPFDARWGVWAAGYGGSQSTSGDANLGSNKTTSNVFGSAVGADYRFSPNTVAGFALAGGGTHFNVANNGSGNSDLFQAGAYLRHTEGAAFIAAALAYGWQDVTTNRTVTAFGIDSLRANFKTNAISGRLEGGYRVATAVGDITPYAAGQFTTYRLPSYMEQVAFGAGTFALNYNGKDVTATRSELGMKAEKAMPMTDATLMLRGRLAWAHDFNTDRNVQATFQSLPGSAFVVNGASPAADTALTTVSAETIWRNGWAASLTADAQLSDTTHSYSGKGVVRYNW